MSFLQTLTEDCRVKGHLPERQCVDIKKKIEGLKQQWPTTTSGPGAGAAAGTTDGDPPLNADAQHKLFKMTDAAEHGQWDQALKIQVGLNAC